MGYNNDDTGWQEEDNYWAQQRAQEQQQQQARNMAMYGNPLGPPGTIWGGIMPGQSKYKYDATGNKVWVSGPEFDAQEAEKAKQAEAARQQQEMWEAHQARLAAEQAAANAPPPAPPPPAEEPVSEVIAAPPPPPPLEGYDPAPRQGLGQGTGTQAPAAATFGAQNTPGVGRQDALRGLLNVPGNAAGDGGWGRTRNARKEATSSYGGAGPRGGMDGQGLAQGNVRQARGGGGGYKSPNSA